MSVAQGDLRPATQMDISVDVRTAEAVGTLHWTQLSVDAEETENEKGTLFQSSFSLHYQSSNECQNASKGPGDAQ